MFWVRYILLIFLFLTSKRQLVAQTQMLPAKDTSMAIIKVPDSILHKQFVPYYTAIKTGIGSDTHFLHSNFQQRLLQDDKTGLAKKGTMVIDAVHVLVHKEALFYVLLGLLSLLSVVMYFFDDYFISFLQSFTHPEHRLLLTTENYALGYFPAFLLNLLFVLSGGMYIAMFMQQSTTTFTYWEWAGLCAIVLGVVYITKYLVVFASGYLFNASYAARLYIQVVYTVNKLIGILLIPVLWAIMFSNNPGSDLLVKNVYSIFFALLMVLVLYRYFVSFVLIKNNLKISVFHFFIYLCAIELLPILIIFKYLKEHFKPVV